MLTTNSLDHTRQVEAKNHIPMKNTDTMLCFQLVLKGYRLTTFRSRFRSWILVRQGVCQSYSWFFQQCNFVGSIGDLQI